MWFEIPIQFAAYQNVFWLNSTDFDFDPQVLWTWVQMYLTRPPISQAIPTTSKQWKPKWYNNNFHLAEAIEQKLNKNINKKIKRSCHAYSFNEAHKPFKKRSTFLAKRTMQKANYCTVLEMDRTNHKANHTVQKVYWTEPKNMELKIDIVRINFRQRSKNKTQNRVFFKK